MNPNDKIMFNRIKKNLLYMVHTNNTGGWSTVNNKKMLEMVAAIDQHIWFSENFECPGKK